MLYGIGPHDPLTIGSRRLHGPPDLPPPPPPPVGIWVPWLWDNSLWPGCLGESWQWWTIGCYRFHRLLSTWWFLLWFFTISPSPSHHHKFMWYIHIYIYKPLSHLPVDMHPLHKWSHRRPSTSNFLGDHASVSVDLGLQRRATAQAEGSLFLSLSLCWDVNIPLYTWYGQTWTGWWFQTFGLFSISYMG